MRMLFSRLLSALKSSGFRWIAPLAALAVLIWFVGPGVKYADRALLAPVPNRIAAIALLVAVWCAAMMWKLVRQRREQAARDALAAAAAHSAGEAEAAAIRKSFHGAMQLLRSTWKGLELENLPHDCLPWFLVIGPQESGKSSLIAGSGLKFPLGHVIEDPADPSLPRYAVTDDGVLFDLPGAWLAQENESESESRAWPVFLDLLAEERPDQPLNGIVLCVDVLDLIRSDDARRAQVAAMLHGRLVEAAERLHVRFTVQVVLSKLDQLAGFTTFASDIGTAERRDPFGVAFSISVDGESAQWLDSFREQYAALMHDLNDEALDRLLAQRSFSERRDVYLFTRQIAALEPLLVQFLDTVLHTSRFSIPPLPRGVYFTSALQEGVPFNATLSRVARDYRMPSPVLPAYSQLSKRFFIERLFLDVIFREAGLAGGNRKVGEHRKLAFNAALTACGLAVLAVGSGLFAFSDDNRGRAQSILAMTFDFAGLADAAPPAAMSGPRQSEAGQSEIRQSEIAQSETAFLPGLNIMSVANDVFPDWEETGEWRRFAALYQGRRIGPEVREAYERYLRDRFMPRVADRVREEIIRLGQDRQARVGDERQDALRVYLLLGDLDKRRQLNNVRGDDGTGRRIILAWFARYWQQRFGGQAPIQDQLGKHLAYAIDTDRIAPPLDETLVERVQAALREIPREVRLYRALKALADRQALRGVSLREEIGASFDVVFGGNGAGQGTDAAGIPYFYTRRGFLEFFVPNNDALSIVAIEDAWVSGEREDVSYSQEDLGEFREKVRHRYVTDYINAWQAALDALDITAFRSLDDAVRVLSEINGPADPFGRLLGVIKRETEIYAAAAVEPQGEQLRTQITLDPNREQGLRIVRAFADLAAIVTANEGEKAYMEELMASVSALQAYVQAIAAARQSSRLLALERAEQRARLEGDDPIYLMRRIGAAQSQPLKRLFAQLADNSWRVVLAAARIDLQAVWQNGVYRSFNVDLASRYPFDEAAADEISLDQFQQFFGPGGQFDTFFEQHLRSFVDDQTGEAVLIDGQSLKVSKAFLEQIRTVRSIRDMFFNAQGVPTLRYTMEPVAMTGQLSRAVLNIEGQLIPFSHGPTRPISVIWPNALSGRQSFSKLVVVGGTPGSEEGYNGLWSSFRLFGQAQIGNIRPDSVDITLSIGNARVMYRMRMSTERNPFVQRPLASVRLPESL